jgi:glycerophosphoryl diester phosphodiesterase
MEHIRWAKWQNYLHSFLKWNEENYGWILPHEQKDRWQTQIQTPYSMLSEKEKESDRKESRNYIPFLISSQISLLEEMQKWAKEKEKFYTETKDKAQDKRLMTAWEDFESKRMATVSLLTYLKEQIEIIKKTNL